VEFAAARAFGKFIPPEKDEPPQPSESVRVEFIDKNNPDNGTIAADRPPGAIAARRLGIVLHEGRADEGGNDTPSLG
jgi:hypothetical protein